MINSASVVNIPFLQMKNGLDELVAGGTKYFHIDIMDGHYVPNLCMSIKYLKEINEAYPEIIMDVHLMVSNPVDYINQLKEAGADYVGDQDYLDKVNSTSMYTYKTPELFQQYKSQLLLDEAIKYTEKPEENKIILNSETIYYYDDEITPTVYTDYIRSLEDNAFQCND